MVVVKLSSMSVESSHLTMSTDATATTITTTTTALLLLITVNRTLVICQW